MSSSKALIGSALAAVLLLPAAPAVAQREPSRTGRVANEVARGVRDVAEAIGTISGAVDDSVTGLRYRGAERYAIDRCTPSLERIGRVRVDDVRPYGRRSWRVHGTVDRGGYYDRYRSSGYPVRAFACTVRDDGRIKLKTSRARA